MGPSREAFISCSPKTSATEEKLKVNSAEDNSNFISCFQELRHKKASFSLYWEYSHSLS
jgi:hypothetical protein